MAVLDFIMSKYITGTSADDLSLDISQMTEEDSYAIKDVKGVIAYDIYRSLDRFFDSRYTEEMIRDLLDTDGKYRLDVCDFGSAGVVDYIILGVDNVAENYWYAVQGEFITRQLYVVTHIAEGNVGYLVTDHVIAPDRGVDLVERCYHPYFEDMYEARQYRHEMMSDYHNNRGARNSGFRVSVVDIPKLENSEWYKMSLQLVKEIEQYDLDPEDFRYIKDIHAAHDKVLAESYEELPLQEQAALNKQLIEGLRPYIPDEVLVFVEEDLKDASYSTIIEEADYVITVALVNATTQEDFDAIHAVLGPSDYRVGNLTDDIYLANPDVGYIVVDRNGYMQWYDSCYAINDWSGSESSPFHGVFQPNENNTLLSFREFHPEKHPIRLPMDDDIEEWDIKYRSFMHKKRQVHDELRFDPPDVPGGPERVYGEWFCEGDGSEKSYFITFDRVYGTHTFTESEIIDLLNGDEVTIEGFVTQMEIEVTIKGKLEDKSNIMDSEMNVVFSRTDIKPSERREINASMGIEEPL